jgi:hypothetical protein
MMEAVRTSETSVDNHFTRQYIPEDNSDHHRGKSFAFAGDRTPAVQPVVRHYNEAVNFS